MIRYMEKTKLIAIKDFQNQGKSTTIWLLLFTLVNDYHAEIVRLYNQNEEKDIEKLPDTIPADDDMYDIYAELRLGKQFIILFSRGDYPDRLVEDVNWALQFEPAYIVCAIQMRPINRDIWNTFNSAFPNTRYRRVFFGVEHAEDENNALTIKQPTVEAIIKYMA